MIQAPNIDASNEYIQILVQIHGFRMAIRGRFHSLLCSEYQTEKIAENICHEGFYAFCLEIIEMRFIADCKVY